MYRLRGKILCCSLKAYAYTDIIFSLLIFGCILFVCVYLTETNAKSNAGISYFRMTATGVFSILATMYVMQLVGLLLNKIIIMKIFKYFQCFLIGMVLIMFGVMGVWLMINVNIKIGWKVLSLGCFFVAVLNFSLLVNHSIICNIEEKRRNLIQM